MSPPTPVVQSSFPVGFRDEKATSPDPAAPRIPSAFEEASPPPLSPSAAACASPVRRTALEFMKNLPPAESKHAPWKASEPKVVRKMRDEGLGLAIIKAGQAQFESMLRAKELLEQLKERPFLRAPVLVERWIDGVRIERPMIVVGIKSVFALTVVCVDQPFRHQGFHDISLEHLYERPGKVPCELVEMGWRRRYSQSKVEDAVKAAEGASFDLPIQIADDSFAQACQTAGLSMLRVHSPLKQTMLCFAKAPLNVAVLPPIAEPKDGWAGWYYEVPIFFIKPRKVIQQQVQPDQSSMG